MRAAVYARVSSAKQRDQHTIESQLRDGPAFCNRMGWSVVGVYMDDGRTAKSGNLEARGDWHRLERDMTAGAIDVVVMVDQDRLTRAEDLAERGAMLGALQRNGVKLANWTTGQVLDLGTSTGDLIASLQGFFAADWLRKHRERIIAGKFSAIARGRKPAGPTPFGYRYDRATGIWSIHEGEAETVCEIYRRVAAGESTMVIAADFNERGVPRHEVVGRAPQWERARIYAIARSSTYRGEWRANKKKRLTIPVPRIVDDELWHAAGAAFESYGKRGLRRTKHVYLLEKLAVCEACGAPINIASATPPSWTARNTRRPGNPARYMCSRFARPLHGQPRCTTGYMRVADVDARAWAAFVAALDGADLKRAVRLHGERDEDDADLHVKDAASARARLARLAKVEEAVLARFRKGAISDAALDTELGAIGRERSLLEHQVAASTRGAARATKARSKSLGAAALILELRRRIDGATLEQQRAIFETLFDRGSFVLGPSGIRAKGRIRFGAGAATSSHAETALRFRLVC